MTASGTATWGTAPGNTSDPNGIGGPTDNGYAAPGQAQYGLSIVLLSDSSGAPGPAPNTPVTGTPQLLYTASPGTSATYSASAVLALVGAQTYPIRVWGIFNDNVYSDNSGTFSVAGNSTGMSTAPQTSTPGSFAYTGASSYNLTWAVVSGATYNVYEDGAFLTNTGTALLYHIGAPAPGSYHYYQVSALTPCGGESVLSSPITVSNPLPGTITLAQPALRCGTEYLTLNWIVTSGTDTSWQVKQNGTVIATLSSGTTYPITGIAIGTPYTFEIVGQPGATVSNDVTITPYLCPAPTWPGCEGPQSNISWNTVMGADYYTLKMYGVPIYTGSLTTFLVRNLKMGIPEAFTWNSTTGGITTVDSAVLTITPCPVCNWKPLPRPACGVWSPPLPI